LPNFTAVGLTAGLKTRQNTRCL